MILDSALPYPEPVLSSFNREDHKAAMTMTIYHYRKILVVIAIEMPTIVPTSLVRTGAVLARNIPAKS